MAEAGHDQELAVGEEDGTDEERGSGGETTRQGLNELAAGKSAKKVLTLNSLS